MNKSMIGNLQWNTSNPPRNIRYKLGEYIFNKIRKRMHNIIEHYEVINDSDEDTLYENPIIQLRPMYNLYSNTIIDFGLI